MRGFVAPTDHGWYQFLRARPEIDEVNFWRPGATAFSALEPGEIFFFKLKAPYNAIGGFVLFARFAPLPVWRALPERLGSSWRIHWLCRFGLYYDAGPPPGRGSALSRFLPMHVRPRRLARRARR